MVENSDVISDEVEVDGKKYRVSTVKLLVEEFEGFLTEEAEDQIEEEGMYETSIFPFEEGEGEVEPDLSKTLYMDRYKSEEEAKKGHKRILKKLEKGELDLED